jgi:hypothetical protein
MRRQIETRSGAQTKPSIRRHKSVAGTAVPAWTQIRRARKPKRIVPIGQVALSGPGIFDDFPQVIPVSRRELEVIETYLGDLLDGALGKLQ